MESYSKDDLREDFDLLIQAWIKSDNENTTFLAESLATYAVEKLNGEIRESYGEFCQQCENKGYYYVGFPGNRIMKICNCKQNSQERTE